MQNDQLQNITGQFLIRSLYADTALVQGASGVFADEGSVGNYDGCKYGGNFPQKRITFDASRVARTGGETRPVNFTIRVWRRIA